MGGQPVNLIKCLSLWCFWWLAAGTAAKAQNQPNWITGMAWQQGTVLVHTPKIKHLAGTKPNGFELNAQISTTGHRYWHQLYRYPRLGISFVYFNYHNSVLGQSFALSPYLSLPVKQNEKGSLFFRFGTGVAYFTNRYSLKENPTNNVISNNFNAVIQTRLEYSRPLNGNLGILAAIGLNHYSNGGDAKPNLGINIGTATVGLNYYGRPAPINKIQETDLITQRNFVFVSSSFGIKQRADFDTVKYVVNALAIGALHRLNQKSTLSLALEGFYDPSLFPRRAWDPRLAPGTTPDIRRFAITAGHELNFGSLAFGTQVGYYFYRPYQADSGIFQRLETKLQLHKNVFISASLKLHDIIKADIIEYRLGLRI